jgi:hypothetical protein
MGDIVEEDDEDQMQAGAHNPQAKPYNQRKG